ncbi:hypothetical protein PUN28_001331 [Cardiocondyla obscurior]|uniref:Uncharacterized protein n=1 Tax=Cardiocondyla obscurior TaxID=286306 RepID=A0AAW2H4G1_9HYME
MIDLKYLKTAHACKRSPPDGFSSSVRIVERIVRPRLMRLTHYNSKNFYFT